MAPEVHKKSLYIFLGSSAFLQISYNEIIFAPLNWLANSNLYIGYKSCIFLLLTGKLMHIQATGVG